VKVIYLFLLVDIHDAILDCNPSFLGALERLDVGFGLHGAHLLRVRHVHPETCGQASTPLQERNREGRGGEEGRERAESRERTQTAGQLILSSSVALTRHLWQRFFSYLVHVQRGIERHRKASAWR